MLLIWVFTALSSTHAISLTGSSEYAVPGREFNMICDVPEKAFKVQLYRRPDVTTPVGSIHVGGGYQCYNSIPIRPVVCSPDVCSCTSESIYRGTVFRWVIQPQTGDDGSEWYCNRTNPSLLDSSAVSPDYTLKMAEGHGSSKSTSPPDVTYKKKEGGTIPSPVIKSLGYEDGEADVTENGSKAIICKVESSPPSTITWFYKTNGTVLFTTSEVLESTYTLTTASCLDTGMYTCSVRNSASNKTVTKDIYINVLCKPRPNRKLAEHHVIEASLSANLTLPAVFIANPQPSFTWTFQPNRATPAKELRHGIEHFAIQNFFERANVSSSSLEIRTNITEEWFGLYNVTATNSQGISTVCFIVREQQRSGSADREYWPVTAIICGSVVVLMLAIWLGIFICRKSRKSFRKGEHFQQSELRNHLSERAVTLNAEEEERSRYEQLNRTEIANVSLYSDIIGHVPGRQNDQVNDRREYETLEVRSHANVYEELHGATSGNPGIYINTEIAGGSSNPNN